MIESPPHACLTEILQSIEANPRILGKKTSDCTISVTHSSTSKRFTDFHRLVASSRETQRHEVFWLRCIKNKPFREAQTSLQKQFDVLSRAFQFFRRMNLSELQLSVCEPVALFKNQNCLITRECRGHLMNRYLLARLPIMQQAVLEATFRNVGIWLKCFHVCFSDGATERTICHCDFSPRNVFVSRGSVEVIDFAGARPGAAQEDVEFFVRYVSDARFNGLYSRRRRSRLVDAFVNAYSTFEPQVINGSDLPVHVVDESVMRIDS